MIKSVQTNSKKYVRDYFFRFQVFCLEACDDMRFGNTGLWGSPLTVLDFPWIQYYISVHFYHLLLPPLSRKHRVGLSAATFCPFSLNFFPGCASTNGDGSGSHIWQNVCLGRMEGGYSWLLYFKYFFTFHFIGIILFVIVITFCVLSANVYDQYHPLA